MRPEVRLLSATSAGHELGVSAQTVRDWARSGKLRGSQGPTGRWLIEDSSVQEVVATEGRRGRPVNHDLERRLDIVVEEVAMLRTRDVTENELVSALTRERDRYRADSATIREAALKLAVAAREQHRAVKTLLEVLDLQADTLAELLAPASLHDMPPPARRPRSRHETD
ncbi:MAG TPA: helix-turn-helix domain-containing protein [Candidatus Acidoferrum sp.]|jgi:predicted site-specific integrase-resolvase|nr:helix-turn-helix domain-containing protein [Candidatus Acidoferrum sp.]